MMRAVAEACVAAGIACQVSMETPMPCGIGICVGCVITALTIDVHPFASVTVKLDVPAVLVKEPVPV